MATFRLLPPLVALALLAFCWSGIASSPPVSQPADVGGRPSASLDEPSIQEIEAIRRKIGVNPLQGSLLEDLPGPADRQMRQEFGTQLRKLSGVPPKEATPLAADDYRRLYLQSLQQRCTQLADELESLRMQAESDQLKSVAHRLLEAAQGP